MQPKAWLQRHLKDPFVRAAQADNLRSRGAYKLMQILAAFPTLIRPGDTVIDLGAAPGGWSQVAAQRTGPRGTVIAVDLLPMEPIDGVHFHQGDFARVLGAIEAPPANAIISDMAPNLTGIAAIDSQASFELLSMAIEMACARLVRPNGVFLAKAFHSPRLTELRARLEGRFQRVTQFKPAASRKCSAEVYLIAQNLQKA